MSYTTRLGVERDPEHGFLTLLPRAFCFLWGKVSVICFWVFQGDVFSSKEVLERSASRWKVYYPLEFYQV